MSIGKCSPGESTCSAKPFEELDFEKTYPATVRSIEIASARVMRCLKRKFGDSENEFQMELALREALANAVLHGCKQDAEKEICVAVYSSPAVEVRIVVRDSGDGFDPSEVPSPISDEHLYSRHGRGIFLIRQFMDEVHFEKGGREIHMTKRLTELKRSEPLRSREDRGRDGVG